MANAFSSDLYAQLSATKGNLFFSPTSIQTALAMTWGGAKGRTADEMAKTLHFDAGAPVLDAGFLGDSLCRIRVIAGQHDALDAEFLQACDGVL